MTNSTFALVAYLIWLIASIAVGYLYKVIRNKP